MHKINENSSNNYECLCVLMDIGNKKYNYYYERKGFKKDFGMAPDRSYRIDCVAISMAHCGRLVWRHRCGGIYRPVHTVNIPDLWNILGS